MYVVSVTIFVKPEKVREFIEATLDNARNTRRAAGTVRRGFCCMRFTGRKRISFGISRRSII
jgi:hypothetical protein